MTDTPGWASPGSSPSDGPERGGTLPSGASELPAPPQDSAPTPQPSAPPNWSQQQPPPGQWSAPAGGGAPPPPAPGPAWGAPGGWQPAPWGKPPAAKPGVIPLRPLGIGEILDGAVSTMRAHWRTVLGISLAVAVVVQTATVLLQGLLLKGADTSALQDPNADLDEVMRAFSSTFASTGIALLISVIGTIVATAILTMIVSRAVLGQSVTTGEAWRDARPRILSLLGLTFLLLLIGTVILTVGLAPGLLVSLAGGTPAVGVALTVLGGCAAFVVMLWVWMRYSLASPALMLEKQGIRRALTRSAKLVRGAWWRVFGIQMLAALLVTVVSSIIAIPFTVIAIVADGNGLSAFAEGQTNTFSWTFLIISGIGAMIGSTITLPISSGVTALLYMDQRIRREALDIELARAAGLPGHDAPGPANHPSGSNATGG